jgi:hypothetical protein
VRLVCVDLTGAADDVAFASVAAASLERARSLAASDGRVLLFGDAARLASQQHQAAWEQREGAWLDASARWLLREDDLDGDAPAPGRPVADVFDDRAVAVVGGRAAPLALPCTDRFLELVDGLVVMAVPGDDAVDVFDNAHLWLVGGAPFAVSPRGAGRALVHTGGHVVVVDVARGEAVVTAHPVASAAAGAAPVTHVVSLVPQSRMAVRGGDRP